MAVWLPGWPRDESILGAGGGSYTSGPGKFLWHTTEGSWDGSMSVFRSRLTAPHVMVDPKARRRVQFIPLDRSAYALRNEAGGVETNREQVLQVEVVWWAARAHELTDGDLEWLGREVLAPMVAAAPFPIAVDRFPTFYGPDAGFTLATPDARQRMPAGVWDSFSGQVGHQHVPENSHWDPGALNVAKITAAAQGDEVTADDIREINKGTAMIVGAATARVIEQNRQQTAVLRRAVWRAQGKTVEQVAALEAEDPIPGGPTAEEIAGEVIDALGDKLAGG